MDQNLSQICIVMIGATGAVGGHVVQTLLQTQAIGQLTLLGRRPVPDIDNTILRQEKVDILDPGTYIEFLKGHDTAICTLGVGQPSKISKEDFVKIDKLAVLDFAKACKNAGIRHFELLASVGIDPKSSSFYLRTKGELVEGLKALNFERLSIFKPSMILTPTNRYGLLQAITLKVWPIVNPLFFGGLRKYKGVKVEVLGRAMALNVLKENSGYENLLWDEFKALQN